MSRTMLMLHLLLIWLVIHRGVVVGDGGGDVGRDFLSNNQGYGSIHKTGGGLTSYKYKVEYKPKILPKVEKLSEVQDESIVKLKELSKVRSESAVEQLPALQSDEHGDHGDIGDLDKSGKKEVIGANAVAKDVATRLERRKTIRYEKKAGKHREITQQIDHIPWVTKVVQRNRRSGGSLFNKGDFGVMKKIVVVQHHHQHQEPPAKPKDDHGPKKHGPVSGSDSNKKSTGPHGNCDQHHDPKMHSPSKCGEHDKKPTGPRGSREQHHGPEMHGPPKGVDPDKKPTGSYKGPEHHRGPDKHGPSKDGEHDKKSKGKHGGPEYHHGPEKHGSSVGGMYDKKPTGLHEIHEHHRVPGKHGPPDRSRDRKPVGTRGIRELFLTKLENGTMNTLGEEKLPTDAP